MRIYINVRRSLSIVVFNISFVLSVVVGPIEFMYCSLVRKFFVLLTDKLVGYRLYILKHDPLQMWGAEITLSRLCIILHAFDFLLISKLILIMCM